MTAVVPFLTFCVSFSSTFLLQVFFIMPFSRFKISLEAAMAGFLIVTPILGSAVVTPSMFTSQRMQGLILTKV